MNLPLLYKEKMLINHQFPMVRALNDPPSIYEGMLRCEKGEVKKLAEKGVWPFVEYINWHKFRMTLLEEYPLKPPIVTWLTDISHPNIVPNIPGAVCVSILGDKWRPDLKLISVINSLFYLLSDPNPNNVFDDPKCLEAAKVCRTHGFPKQSIKKKVDDREEIVHFNIIPVPTQEKTKDDVVHFRIPLSESKSEKE